MDHDYHASGRVVPQETTRFLGKDSLKLAVVAKAASDDVQQYFAGGRYQLDTPVVPALHPIFYRM